MIGLSAREAALLKVLSGKECARTKDLAASTGFHDRNIRDLMPRLAAKGFITITDRAPWRYMIERPPHEKMIEEVAQRLGVEEEVILGRNKSGRAALARRQVVAGLISIYGWSAVQAASAINRAPRTLQGFRRAAA